jgi:bla regulator protein blaR1
MSARMLLSNLVSFTAQVAVLIATGAALARAFRLDRPPAMLAYWRTLFLACLVLPLCQPWDVVIPPALTTATVATQDIGAAPAEAVVAAAPRPVVWPIGDVVLIVLAAGIAVRALWLTIGAYGLLQLRRDASPLDPVPESVRLAQGRIGTRASMYTSERVSSPITFGLIRPVVVFPMGVSAMPADVQEAIACHELLHVRRRDWLYEVLEEIVRSVLWFHPAVWWLIGRIQLTREQVVDQAAIQLTDSKERYVESLLAVALASSRTTFAPASPFLRRHLLKKRVARILQETTMTTRRLIASLTTSAAVLALAAGLAVRYFPLQAQGHPAAAIGEPIQILKGAEHLIHGDTPGYPRRAVEQKIQGDVVVELTLNERGEVSDARVLTGPDELRKATLEAVLTWHYASSAINSTVTHATIRFTLPPPGFEKAEFARKLYAAREDHDGESVAVAIPLPEHAAGPLREIEKALEDPSNTAEQRAELEAKHIELRKMIEKARAAHEGPLVAEVELKGRSELFKLHEAMAWKVGAGENVEHKPEAPARLIRIKTERVPEAMVKELLAQTGVAVGGPITPDTAKLLRQTARAMDEHFQVEFHKEDNGVILAIVAR